MLRRLPPFETSLVVLAVIVLTALSLLSQKRAGLTNLQSYSSFDADKSGYRAWYELLERESVRVERLEQPPAYLDQGLDTLIWAPFGDSSSESDAQALAGWVSAGGRLIFLGQDAAAQKDGSLKLPKATDPRALRASHLASELLAAGVHRVDWSAKPVRWTKLAKHTTVLASDASGPLIVRYALGRGQVLAVADPEPFSNANLASPDDARLAYYLGAPRRAATRVSFDERAHGHLIAAHWWQVLPRALVVALAIATLALLIAFAGAAIRLGPPLVTPRLRDPTSLEFLDSVAALLERGHGAGQAVADAVASTRRVVASALGMPEDSPLPDLAAAMSSDEQRRRFVTLMAAERFTQPDDATLVGVVSLAASLRKEFSTYGPARR